MLFIFISLEEYLLDIDKFSRSERIHCKFKEGDFFRFKIDRGIYGYGRILFNFDRLRKEKIPHWDILMGKPLIIKVYHIVAEEEPVELGKLRELLAIASRYIMDNKFFYGEYEIVGNIPLNDSYHFILLTSFKIFSSFSIVEIRSLHFSLSKHISKPIDL